MNRVFKYIIMGLLLLDVAVLPRACDKRKDVSNEGELYVHITTSDKKFVDGMNNLLRIEGEYEVGDELPFEAIASILSESVEKKGYNIIKYFPFGNMEETITASYQIRSEDIVVYCQGKRGAIIIEALIEKDPYFREII